MDFKETIWNFLIAYGGAIKVDEDEDPDLTTIRVVERWGENLNADYDKSMAILEKIKTYGIDYEKTSSVKDGLGDAFTNTFNPPEELPYIIGTLVCKDGTSALWGVLPGAEMGLARIQRMLANPITSDAAIEIFESRISNLPNYGPDTDTYYFNSTCRFPHDIGLAQKDR